MADKLFIIATEARSGQSLAALGLMQLLSRAARKVAFFRPVIHEPRVAGAEDADIALLRSQFGLEQSYADSYVYTLSEARELINSGKRTQLLETVLQRFRELEEKHEFVLCMGTDLSGRGEVFEFDLNAEIAANLGAPVLMVASGAEKSPREITDSAHAILGMLHEKGLDVLACVVNQAAASSASSGGGAVLPMYFLPENPDAINNAPGYFERHVNVSELGQRIADYKAVKITPKMFECNLLERARRNKMRIVLPEGAEERILRATEILSRRGVAEIILLGGESVIRNKIRDLGLDFEPNIIDPEQSPNFGDYVATYQELRKAKNISPDQARNAMLDNTYYGTMMVYKGHADGMVSGAINTTAHTIRPSFEFIKTKPGVSIVSSVFLMCLKDRVLAFGDCAVNPNPTPEQLAGIAISSAQTARVFGIEPRVAMLSYSTGTSGKGADVDSVVEAVKIAGEKAPDLLLEGPLQYDAAIDPEVARTKLPDSQVAGRATVFIFPDLNTGNNTYKAVQRAANAVAIGPVLQGLNKPVNDLSRGCTVPDIVNTVAITAIQAQAEKGLE